MKKLIHKKSLAIAISITLFGFSEIALSIPANTLPDVSSAEVKLGSAVMTQNGNVLTIDTSTGVSTINGNTLIKWGGGGFNIGSDSTVNFNGFVAGTIILNHDVQSTFFNSTNRVIWLMTLDQPS